MSIDRRKLLEGRARALAMMRTSHLPDEVKALAKQAADKAEAALELDAAMARKRQRGKRSDEIRLPGLNTAFQPIAPIEADGTPCARTVGASKGELQSEVLEYRNGQADQGQVAETGEARPSVTPASPPMKSTFFDKLKIFVRWAIFVPAAFVASALAGAVVKYVLPFTPFSGLDDDSVVSHASLDAIVGLAMGTAFVYCGTRIAPSHKRQVAYVLFSIMLVTIGVTILSALLGHSYWAIWSSIFSAIGGVYVAHAASEGKLA